jgi:hypothetical protein
MDEKESMVFAWLSAFMDSALKFYMWRNWWVRWRLQERRRGRALIDAVLASVLER